MSHCDKSVSQGCNAVKTWLARALIPSKPAGSLSQGCNTFKTRLVSAELTLHQAWVKTAVETLLCFLETLVTRVQTRVWKKKAQHVFLACISLSSLWRDGSCNDYCKNWKKNSDMRKIAVILRSEQDITIKRPKNLDTPKIYCNDPKIWLIWIFHREMGPNYAGVMSNSVDPDRTAPLGAFWSRSTLSCLSENLGTLQ